MTGFLSLLLTLTLSFLTNYFFLTPVLSSEKIQESANISYIITSEELLLFDYEITLSVPQAYPTAISRYNISFPFQDMTFESIISGGESLKAEKEVKEGKTLLSLYFDEKILNYNNPIDIKIAGLIKDELLTKTDTSTSFNLESNIGNIKAKKLSITYPKSLGDLSTSTTNWDVKTEDEKITLQTQDTPKIISLVWGDTVAYNFELKKIFVNGVNEATKSFDITVPKSHFDQKLIITEISPSPHSAYQDKEGNIFLTYHVEANTEIHVYIAGQIIKHLDVGNNSLSPFDKPILTEIKGYWELKDAYELNRFTIYLKRQGVEQDHIEKMSEQEKQTFYKFAYEYTVNRFFIKNLKTSSMESNTRQGVEFALKNSDSATPEDYVDFLTAIYRKYGVPTKMLEGYVLQTTNFYHSWLQYWDDEYGWKMVDPALADYTKQDFFHNNFQNHIVILNRGYNYLNPRISFLSDGDFNVSLAETEINENISIENSVQINPIRKINRDTSGIVEIKNNGNTIISMQHLKEHDEINFGLHNDLQLIVPNQTVTIPFKYSPKNSNESFWLTYISVNGEEITNPLNLETEEGLFWWWDILVLTSTLLVIWVIIYISYLILKYIFKWIKNYYQ